MIGESVSGGELDFDWDFKSLGENLESSRKLKNGCAILRKCLKIHLRKKGDRSLDLDRRKGYLILGVTDLNF